MLGHSQKNLIKPVPDSSFDRYKRILLARKRYIIFIDLDMYSAVDFVRDLIFPIHEVELEEYISDEENDLDGGI